MRERERERELGTAVVSGVFQLTLKYMRLRRNDILCLSRLKKKFFEKKDKFAKM